MKNLLTLVISIFLFTNTQAQVLNPVKWTYSTEQINKTEYNLVFSAKIDKNWHLYSVYSPDNGPLPLFFSYEKSDKYELVGKMTESPKPHEVYEDVYKITVKQFSDKAKFVQKIKIKTSSEFILKGNLDGQSCLDEGMCVPVTEDFELTISPNTKITSNNKAETTELKEDKSLLIKEEDKISLADKDTIINIKKEDINIVLENKTLKDEHITKSEIDNTEEIPINEENSSLWWFFGIAFLSGLAAILTPCVFPMIPMTVSFFMNSSKNKTKAKAQAIFYAISIITIYTIIGTVVAVTLGANFANWLSTHWIPNVFFFIIFVFFAFSFFGMFEITLPSWIVNKSDAQADKGGWSGAFFMAFTLVLVSFSCTGPIVGAILVESASGEILKPIIGMFGFSLAFALPFGIFAFFPSLLNKMPKSGGWLNSVKVVLGFIELALGLKFLSIADQTYHWGILDRDVYLALWIVIFTLMGIYLLGKLKFAHDSDVKFISVPRLMLSIATLSFVVYMIPGMFGAPLKSLSGYLPPQETHDFDLNSIVRENLESVSFSNPTNKNDCGDVKFAEFFHGLPHGLKGFYDYDQAIECSKKQGKPIFIDFTGHGCVNCREMEANVWSDPEVLKMLRNDFIVVALYVDDKTDLQKKDWTTSSYDGKIKKTIGKKFADLQISRFNINAQPYYVILNSEGKQLTKKPHSYNKNIGEFIDFLKEGIKNFQQ